MLWEENLNHKEKKMKNVESDKIDTIKDTKIESINGTWIIIGGEKKWVRKCPKCDESIYHKNKKNCNQSNNKKIICRNCKDVSQLKGIYRKCLNCNKEFYAPLSQIKVGWGNLCSIKCNHIFNNIGKYIRTKEILSKQSKSGRKRRYREILEKFGQIHPNFNPNACKFIENFGTKNGYNFQHAQNIGEFYIKELGYWVDGYDKNKNVVIEYNEPHHYTSNGKLNKKDKKRVSEIKQHLKCKFIIYNSSNNKIEIL